MKKIFISIITFFILFILQTSVFHHLAFNDVVPNLILILVCSYGFLRGESSGIITGFLCGLAVDLMFSGFLGFNSLIYMYLGFFNGCLNRLYIDDKVKLPIICIGLSDIIFSIVTYGLKFLLKGHFNFLYYLTKIIMNIVGSAGTFIVIQLILLIIFIPSRKIHFDNVFIPPPIFSSFFNQ